MNFERTYIIAEAGVNHDGSLEKAKELVRVAAASGADAVKFQLFQSKELLTEDAPLADYQKLSGAESQLAMIELLELSEADTKTLRDCAEDHGIDFMASPFDIQSAEFLVDLNVPYIKVPSGELTNLPLMKSIAALRVSSILSTGMANVEEVADAVAPFAEAQTPYALLHCTSSYPTPLDQVHLRAMDTLRHEFQVPVGYSDHTTGTDIACAAVARGAQIIEKHFTLCATAPGPDHAASLEPGELEYMITSIRHIEQALGDTKKQCQPCEENTRDVARRSLVLTKELKAGDAFTADCVAIKRPGTGMSAKDLPNLLGKRASMDFSAGTIVQSDMFV